MDNQQKEQDVIKKILESSQKQAEFAALNNLAFASVKMILEKLLESPEISQEAQEYIWQSGHEKETLKDFIAAEERGRKSGHAEGFGKGVASGIFGTIVFAAVAIFGFLVAKKKEII